MTDRELIEALSAEIAEYLAQEGEEFQMGPFSDTEFVRAEVEKDGQLSPFTSMNDEQWPSASFDVPQLAEWLASSKAVRGALRKAWEGGRDSLVTDLAKPVSEDGFREATPNPYEEVDRG